MWGKLIYVQNYSEIVARGSNENIKKINMDFYQNKI